MKKKIKHGSLFSGIGGFDLAAKWSGWINVFNCEVDPFCRRTLAYHFPRTKSYADIKQTDFSAFKGKINVLTGGFPCQPFSLAGKRRGKEDDRYLWPEMLRAIRQTQPEWVVAENVLGITSWNGGMVLEEVWTDLENQGYQVQPYVLPAAGVGAPHRRERVWIVACRRYKGPGSLPDNICGAKDIAGFIADSFSFGRINGGDIGQGGPILDNKIRDAQKNEPQWQVGKCGPGTTGQTDKPRCNDSNIDNQVCNRQECPGDPWAMFPTEPPVCYPNDGLSYPVDSETLFEGIPYPQKPITFSKWRQESIKAMGNAIVPKVALQIFQTIQMMYDLKFC
ncbi:DNA cytosine methyltransferase [Sphingobacterium sp. DR205]|uniref:DNA cytosine methyltransferase n=1 Tax=Sphingobacterium sp. DR205 TaxID=2713573 RepID=UPI0013E436A5|nr:DNA cytosine methyltransferase [Sphingobacterium sp. DR205]QIH33466.1 DNA cytosine methyltransferase [Sphingobacterium sp. DR205]